MDQEVKNLLRAQSKYGLMGSSAKTGKKIFKGHRSTFCIKVPFGIGQPPPTHQMQSTCVWEDSRVPNPQMEFNYLNSFKSYCIFSNFAVPCGPHGPHINPVVPTSSPLSPHCPRCPHIIPIAPRRYPYGPHGCGLRGFHPMLSLLSLWSPCHPSHLHVFPIISTLSPCCLEGPHIITNPPDTHSHPPPVGGGRPRISKNAIRFELIEIF